MIPWWAVSILPMEVGTPEYSVRKAMQAGRTARILNTDRGATLWNGIDHKAEVIAERKPLELWRQQAWKEREESNGGVAGPIALALRDAALWSPRAFAEICDLTDDEGDVLFFADFQLDMISAMRQHAAASIIVPLEHGKTAISSILVPLMDFAEWNNATECRIYWNETHVQKQIKRLMQQVQYNAALQQVFPWIRKPEPTDISNSWSTEGFSIGGRTIADRSFEPLTARGYSVGNRYACVAADDWVTRGNCSSITEQDKLDEHFHQAVMSMAQRLKRGSRFGTKWGRVYLTGTLYDNRDVNNRVTNNFRKLGYKTIKLSVYPLGPTRPDVVLWPEGRPAEYIEQMRHRLGPRNFRLRMMNQIIEEGMRSFPDEEVEFAQDLRYEYGILPLGCRAVISVDPASGKTTKHTADPAIVLYAEVDDDDPEPEWGQLAHYESDDSKKARPYTGHMVKWKRMMGYDFPKQIAEIANWARYYNLPVVVESNTLQKSYKDQLAIDAPDVAVYLRHTGSADPDDDVEMFAPLFHNKRMRIHARNAPHDEMRALFTQLVEWPQPRKKDLMMAFSFARVFLQKRRRRQSSGTMTANIPAYAEDHLWYWNR